MKTIISMVVLLLGFTAYAQKEKNNTPVVKPDEKNVYVLKNKKQRLVITYEESKRVKPADIKDLSIKGDTLFFTVPAEVFDDFSKRAAGARKKK